MQNKTNLLIAILFFLLAINMLLTGFVYLEVLSKDETNKQLMSVIFDEQTKIKEGLVTSLELSKDVYNSSSNLREWSDKIATIEGDILIKN